MANSFLPLNQDTSESAPPIHDTSLEQLPTETAVPTPEENYDTPIVEAQVESKHFLEEETAPEEEIIEDDAPALTPQTAAPTPNHQAQNVKPIPTHRDPLMLQIEKIMEEDLGDVYSALTMVQKQQFKIKGEETAHKIQQILQGTKVKLGKIIKLLFNWLKLLPGINRFFLEQEAKIKADKIVALGGPKKHTS